MPTTLLVAVVATGLAALACHGSATTPPPGSTVTWAEMDAQARAKHMANVVMPEMKTLFQGFDGQRFGDFNCATCHGAGAKERGFAMPNPELLVLDPSRAYRKHRDEMPEIADFMWSQVEPKMAELLGKPRYVVGHDKGFNCSACHQQQAH